MAVDQSPASRGRGIHRSGYVGPLEVTADINTTEVIQFRTEAYAVIYLPAAFAGTSIQLHVAHSHDLSKDEDFEGNPPVYMPLNDIDGAQIVLNVAASNAYPLPVEVFGVHSLKLVVVGGGGGTIYYTTKG